MSIMNYFSSAVNLLDLPPNESGASRKQIYRTMKFLIESTRYQELCVTFNMRRFGDEEDIILRNHVAATLANAGVASYLLIPCITDNNMLHYHGVIKGTRKSVKQFQRDMIYLFKGTKKDPFIGYTKVSYIRDEEKYINYIKDKHQRSDEYDDNEFSRLTIGMKFFKDIEFLNI